MWSSKMSQFLLGFTKASRLFMVGLCTLLRIHGFGIWKTDFRIFNQISEFQGDKLGKILYWTDFTQTGIEHWI